jgi:hypothetical protein
MSRELLRVPLHLLLLGLLAACGNIPDADLEAASPESLGTAEAAMCSGASVSSLTISGISTYGGEMAGAGTWAVTYPANAVRLDYFIDGSMYASEQRYSDTRSGSWSFSMTGISCGSHTFMVKAYPMVVYSGGSTVCLNNSPQSRSQVVSESCTPSTYCGDYECNGYEDSSSCPEDCGACTSVCSSDGSCCSPRVPCPNNGYCVVSPI